MNIQEMMQQAQKMQSKMQEMQDRLGDVEVEGQAGGGMVKVTMTCKGECRAIVFDPSIVSSEEKEVLEDLTKAAMNDAKSKADSKLAEETQKMMEEMGLPAGMQMPF